MAAMAPSGAGLNWREQLFIGLAWSPKATVQAALGGVPLTMIHDAYGCNCKTTDAEGFCCFDVGVNETLAEAAVVPKVRWVFLETRHEKF